ncbi:hypothetical protein [Jannaschia sp. W003]|nr:hypothetical protein [Jannaschia sp. W003]
MQKLVKAVAVLGLTAAIAACTAAVEDDVVIIEPVTMDPVSTKF